MAGTRAVSLNSMGVTGGVRQNSFFPSVFPAVSTTPTVSIIASGTSTITSAVTFNGANSAFKYTGFGPGVLSGGLAGLYGNAANSAAYLGNDFMVEVCSDAPVIEFRLSAFSTQAMILADGVRLTTTKFNEGSDGQPRQFKVDWGTTRKPRTYQLVGINLAFNGVRVGPNDTIWYPKERDLPVLAVLGDSYTAGNGANDPASTWIRLATSQMGFTVLTDGVGSMGWTSTGVNDPVTRLNAKILAQTVKPSVVVTALGYNDAAGNQATIATNYDAAIAAIRTSAPNAKIITLGPWTPVGATANLTTTKTTLSARAAANGVSFIDIENMVNSANSGIYSEVGPPIDHPVAVGHEYLGYRIGQALFNVLTQSGFVV